MSQVNAEIPDWLDEMISQQAVRLRGKSGWKQYLVGAALIAFLELDESEQKRRVLKAQDDEAARRELMELLERRAGGGGKRRGQNDR